MKYRLTPEKRTFNFRSIEARQTDEQFSLYILEIGVTAVTIGSHGHDRDHFLKKLGDRDRDQSPVTVILNV